MLGERNVQSEGAIANLSNYCISNGLGAAKLTSPQVHCNGTVLQLNVLLSTVCAEDIPIWIVGLVRQEVNITRKFHDKDVS
jgi:hypothetical protein